MSVNDRFKERKPVVVREGRLSYQHRFHGSDIYVDDDGNRFYESWVPDEIPVLGEDRYVEVPVGYSGRLDLMAFSAYGTGQLKWVLAVANGIVDVHSEVVPGTMLRVPLLPSLFRRGILSIRS